MSETEFDVEIVKKTQESLGKFVKKPPLTEKLLRRPPFKFIHDVVKVVSIFDHEKLVHEISSIIKLSIQPKYCLFLLSFVKKQK